jgi:hypothetical protein
VPERLKSLIAGSTGKPNVSLLRQIQPEDVAVLLQTYEARTNVVDREALIWALGKVGDRRVVERFKQALLTDYSGATLTSREQTTYRAHILMLGVLGKDHESAFEFIKQGTSPLFWKATLRWQSATPAEPHVSCAGTCISALGLTGRPEVRLILEQLKTSDLSDPSNTNPLRRSNEGAVVSAAYYLDAIEEIGRDKFLEQYYGPIDVAPMMRWRTSEKARPWVEWKQRYELEHR